MYCFYNYTDPEDRRHWPLLDPGLGVDQMGCGLAPAGAVERAIAGRRQSPTLEVLGSYQLPWREIVCQLGRPPGGSASSGPGTDGPRGPGGLRLESIRGRLAEFVREYGEPEPTLVPESEIPAYVGQVRAGEAAAYLEELPARRVTIFELDP